MPLPIPITDNETALLALRAMLRERSVLGAMQVFNDRLGNIFQITLPGFQPVMLAGPEAARFLLVSAKDDLRWRSEGDPVTELLRHGVLVEDGESHDTLRRIMQPSLHKHMLTGYVEAMWRCTDRVIDDWEPGSTVDMLVEMRKIALLILMETLFKVDFTPDMSRLWRSVLRSIQYISPGLWVLWRNVPRPGYAEALRQMDNYLYDIIRLRRQAVGEPTDLLGLLVTTPEMSDDLIRDQLLTMLIAGHDTSTALLSWTLYLLGKHPNALNKSQEEVDTTLKGEVPTIEHTGSLRYVDRVLEEALRLYPPIHLGSRIAAVDLRFQDYSIPAGTRVMYSIYLTHRLAEFWEDRHSFSPDRFLNRPAPYSYLPFGGGARNCIGAMFAQVESKVVLTRILQKYRVRLMRDKVHAHMGATLEPRPGVYIRVDPRQV
jgi:cytochrome P450